MIDSLDAPESQVLIKVVFLEVQDNTASDIGVQGTYTGANKNYSQLLGYCDQYVFPSSGKQPRSRRSARSTRP